MRKKLIALSVALLTIGGLLTFTTTARADAPIVHDCGLTAPAGEAGGMGTSPMSCVHVPTTVVGLAAAANGEFLIIPEGQDLIPGGYFLTWSSIYSGYSGESGWTGLGSKQIGVLATGTLGSACTGGLSAYNVTFDEVMYSDICGDLNNFSMNDIVEFVAWPYTGNYDNSAFPSEDIFTVTPTDPALTLPLPPDFLTPKTYGDPASVTGTAPAAPAVAITPTAPVITAGATSVIYNGVPQSATYSVDQESSCSTTYNGSSIPPVTAGTYAVSITCTANSLTSTATTTLTITKATPVISWSTPAAITSTTKLGASQLNAFSYIPGSFTYSPAIGSTLPAGDDLVTATFTPTDSTNYISATMTVTIHVTP